MVISSQQTARTHFRLVLQWDLHDFQSQQIWSQSQTLVSMECLGCFLALEVHEGALEMRKGKDLFLLLYGTRVPHPVARTYDPARDLFDDIPKDLSHKTAFYFFWNHFFHLTT